MEWKGTSRLGRMMVTLYDWTGIRLRFMLIQMDCV